MQRNWRPRRPEDGLSGPVESFQNIKVRKLRQVPRDWLGQIHFALLNQLERRNRSDRLRHRCDAKNTVSTHLSAGRIPHAEGAGVETLSPVRDRPDGSGNVSA
jgi:hypothetical protein